MRYKIFKMIFFIFLFFQSLISFSAELTKIECDCVYAEKVKIDVETKYVLSRDDSFLNMQNMQYFYLDDKNRLVFDSENKKRRVVEYNENEISLFDVNPLESSGIVNYEIYKINRNNGNLEGTIGFEYEKNNRLLRDMISIYGVCKKIDTNKIF